MATYDRITEWRKALFGTGSIDLCHKTSRMVGLSPRGEKLADLYNHLAAIHSEAPHK